MWEDEGDQVEGRGVKGQKQQIISLSSCNVGVGVSEVGEQAGKWQWAGAQRALVLEEPEPLGACSGNTLNKAVCSAGKLSKACLGMLSSLSPPPPSSWGYLEGTAW